MDNLYLITLSLIPFLAPDRYKHRATTWVVALLSLFYAAISLSTLGVFELPEIFRQFALTPLTAIFTLTFCCTFSSIMLLHKDEPKRKPLQLSLFYNSVVVLFVSVVGVLISMTPTSTGVSSVSSGMFFGIIWDFALNWELMGLSSFALLILGAERRDILHSAVLYFIVMHLGFLAILGSLVTLSDGSGTLFGSSGIPLITSIILLVGFSVKSAIFPCHFWLPHTYRASRGIGAALMASSSTNMGLCGIILVAQNSTEPLTFSYILIAIGLITTLLGSLRMIHKNSLSGVLSYSSIENSGIILFGIGFALLLEQYHIGSLASFMMIGVVMKFVSHALSKSMLFTAVEKVLQGASTDRINSLGGLWKGMPRTTLLYVLGGLSLSGVPLFGGFLAEFIIFTALLMAISTTGITVVAVLGVLVLSLAAASVVFNISKSFGLAFLGNGRTSEALNSTETTSKLQKVGLWLLTIFSTVGCWVLCAVLFRFSVELFGIDISFKDWVEQMFVNIMVVFVLLVLIVAALIFIRLRLSRKQESRIDPVWSCGYSNETNPSAQYTSESFSDDATLVVTIPKNEKAKRRRGGIKRKISPIRILARWTSRLALFQTGHTSHYIIHIIWFLALILILTLCSVI